jgi:quinol monooxygenase YgiN
MDQKVGLYVQLVAKPGKEQEVADFLTSALPLAQQENETVAWYAIRIDENTFAIFDTFPADEGRQSHLNGPIAAALMSKAEELLVQPPDIKQIDIMACK